MLVQGDYVQKSVHGNMLYSKSLSNGLPKGEKKMKQIEEELTQLDGLCDSLKEKYGWMAK